jgi:hypothetical protein
MNKKIPIALACVSLIVLGLWYMYSSRQDGRGYVQDPAAYAFAQFKATCIVFDAPEEAERVYKNQIRGFRFQYPNDTVVCERTLLNGASTSSMEISLFKKTNFNSTTGNSGPDMTLHVNDTNIDGLPNPLVLEEKEGEIAGSKAIVRRVKSPACTDEECPTFVTYQFEYKGNTFLIEDRVGSDTVVKSFALTD